ncbi:MAG: PorP/SprF family type IX secretion system membrane protein [Bacteroidota bacterium]
MKQYLLLLALLFGSGLALLAQDPHFAQFANTPHLTNPSLIGVYEGSVHATLAYREQWGVLNQQPFRTAAASIDLRRPVLRHDFVGFGVVAMHDDSGPSNFMQSRVYAGGAYLKKLGGKGYKSNAQYLVAGAQVGAGQNRVATDGLLFSDQIETGTPNVIRETQEVFGDNMTPIFLDFNAGLMWYSVFDDNQSLYVGGAVHHLTTPDIALLADETVNLDRRYTVQVGGEVPLNSNVSLLPSAIGWQQGQSRRILAGTHLRYNSRDWKEIALRIGVWGSIANELESSILMDATIVSVMLEMERLDIGMSYDLNTSPLTQVTNGRGAFELTVAYKQPANGRKLKVDCPRF